MTDRATTMHTPLTEQRRLQMDVEARTVTVRAALVANPLLWIQVTGREDTDMRALLPHCDQDSLGQAWDAPYNRIVDYRAGVWWRNNIVPPRPLFRWQWLERLVYQQIGKATRT